MTAPLFFLFLFAGFEFSRANSLRNLCDNVAVETARLGSLPGTTAEMCINSANQSLELLSIRDATIIIEPNVIEPTTPEISVSLVIPLEQNALPMSQFVMGTELRRTVTFNRPIRSE